MVWYALQDTENLVEYIFQEVNSSESRNEPVNTFQQ